MVAQVQAKWADLPHAAQKWAKAGGLIVGVLAALGFGFRLDAVMGSDLEPRVVRIEARMDTLQWAVGDQTRALNEQTRTQDYLICLSEALAGIGSKTPIQCANDRIRSQQ